MLFPPTFSKDIKKVSKRFSLLNILAIPRKIGGVYIFFYNHNFVYVGQSKSDEGLLKRLLNHYNGSQNQDLAVWIEAFDGDLRFTYISCCDNKIDDLERSLIHYLQPITNKIRYLNYRPLSIRWSKEYG